MVNRFWCGLIALTMLGCGTSSSDGAGKGGISGSATGGSGAGSSGAGGSGANSGGSGGDGDPRPPECRFQPASVTLPGTNPVASFVLTWVDQICFNLAPCCDASTFDAAACRVYYSSALSSFASADPAHVAYDPAAGQACLDEIRTDLATCSQPFGGACTKVMRGLLRDGEVCTNGRECASGTCTTAGDHMECGVGPRHALGQPCAVSCSLDEYGAYFCFGQPSLADIGRCFAEDGVYCALRGEPLGFGDGSGATCAALFENGAACVSSAQCASGVCSGGICGTGSDVGGACPCRANLVCIGSTCQAGRRIGEACDSVDNICAPGLGCDGLTGGVCECGGYYGSVVMPIACEF